MADPKLRCVKDVNGDVEHYVHECPVCATVHKHTPTIDKAILIGDRDFRCYSTICTPKGTFLKIVGGNAVNTRFEPGFDTERRKTTEESTALQKQAEEIIRNEMVKRNNKTFGHENTDLAVQEEKPKPPPSTHDTDSDTNPYRGYNPYGDYEGFGGGIFG